MLSFYSGFGVFTFFLNGKIRKEDSKNITDWLDKIGEVIYKCVP